MVEPTQKPFASFSVQRSAFTIKHCCLLVISPEAEDPREHTVLADLFAAGLTSYHLRKPTWTRAQLTAWLHSVPEKFHPRLVLHTHHDLAGEFAVGGLHHRDFTQSVCHILCDKPWFAADLIRSRAVHDISALRTSLHTYDRLLVSPIFPSLSKPGHAPDARLDHAALKSILVLPRHAQVIALGGINLSRLPACCELGFDGVAILGAIWKAANPVQTFAELQSALLAHVA